MEDEKASVDYVDKHANSVWVDGPTKSAWVVVIQNGDKAAYLRTEADGVLSDNLLSLPVVQ